MARCSVQRAPARAQGTRSPAGSAQPGWQVGAHVALGMTAPSRHIHVNFVVLIAAWLAERVLGTVLKLLVCASAGDGTNKAKNLVCNVACRLPGGCPNLHMKLPVVPTATNCRCSSAPWGEVATQSLFPNSTQVCMPQISYAAGFCRLCTACCNVDDVTATLTACLHLLCRQRSATSRRRHQGWPAASCWRASGTTTTAQTLLQAATPAPSQSARLPGCGSWAWCRASSEQPWVIGSCGVVQLLHNQLSRCSWFS